MRCDKPDVCVIGCGGGGAVVAKELAEMGLTVTVLEAGPWYQDPDQEFSGLEWDMLGVNGRFRWGPGNRREAPWQRRLEGLTTILQVAGVGGTTLHYFGNSPRAYPGAIDRSWPLTYRDLIPYYEKVEATLPVAEVDGLSPKDAIFTYGCERIGLVRLGGKDVIGEGWRPQPNAIAKSCTRCGHCFIGCVHPRGVPIHLKAKRSTDVSYIPLALKTGRCRVLANCFVRKILTERGQARGVVYRDDRGVLQEMEARVVVLAAGAVESPRLWLNSGLPTEADVVGRYLTIHYVDHATGFFDRDTFPFLGQTSEARAEFPGKGFLEVTGYGGPAFFAAAVFGNGQISPIGDHGPWRTTGLLWGRATKERMREFPRSVTISAGTDDTAAPFNRVQLGENSSDVDENGRIPLVSYRPTVETLRRRDWLVRKAASILIAAGARPESIHRTNSHPIGVHLHGTMRMGQDPHMSVVDSNCEAYAVKGLFIADNSVFPNALGGPNPTLTCQALATRTAEKIKCLYF
jgi:choline dehydrogenase-like flavoprotein